MTTAQNTIAKEPQNNMADAMQYLYGFQFVDADRLINNLERDFPNHYLSHFTRSQFYWWSMISHQNSHHFHSQYLSNLEKSLDLMELQAQIATKENYWESIFYQINIYASMARLDLLNGDHFRSIRYMRQAADKLTVSLDLTDKFTPFLLTSGLYNYIAGYGERTFPFFRIYTLRYPRGNANRGIEQLTLAANSGKPLVETEANYFLMKIFLELEKDFSAALVHASWLVERYPQNLIFLYHYYQAALQLYNYPLAKEIKNDFLLAIQENQQLNELQRIHFRVLMGV